jgi:hypothetical protein
MVALGNDRTGGALVSFHNSYLFPLSVLLLSFCSPIGATMHIASVSNKYLYAKLGGAERIRFGSFLVFSLQHSYLRSILDF